MASLAFHLMRHRPPETPQERRLTCTTIIEDEPQDIEPPRQQWITHHLSPVIEASPTSNGMPTPTLLTFNKKAKTKKDSQDFDDLYDLTDNEAEEVPIRISASMETPTEEMKGPRRRYPSIIIPSPNQWPSIKKLRKGVSPSAMLSPMMSPSLLSPSMYLSPTPEALARLAARTNHRTSSNAPSLDGSLTSDELSHQSCPSTPELEVQEQNPEDWSAPVQLHPDALETLECLTGVSSDSDSAIFSIPVAEMQEVETGQADKVDILITPVGTDDGSLSLLSIPSPGGFFSALEPSSRHTWLPSPLDAPSTGIAERFYSVPWRDRISKDSIGRRSNQGSPPAVKSPPIVENTIIVPEDDENLTEGPPTARRIPLTSPKASTEGSQNGSQTEVASNGSRIVSTGSMASFPTAVASQQSEYKETYVAELKANSKLNLDRTTLWLDQQTTFIEDKLADKADSPRERSNSDPTSISSTVDDGSNGLPSHKSVRFADDSQISISGPTSKESSPTSPKDSTLVRGFKHLSMNAQMIDAFVHRKTRNEALRLDRRCLFSMHVNQLEGKYDISAPDRVAPMRPISHLNIGEQEEQSAEKEMIADAQRERRALEQIKPVSWNLEATKLLNGGTLLMSPTGKTFSRVRRGRVLDLGGQSSCDWAWQVALEHPNSAVNTVYTGEQLVDSSIEGPENHVQLQVANLWTLPFPDDYFHVVSARNLFAQLRTFKPAGSTADEFDLTLAECMRVLKPGGCLEFALLDADILRSGPLASALSVEFCFNLRTRGYDPCATKAWLPRLRKAGFGQVRRAWLVLPMAQQSDAEMFADDKGTTADASLISGLVGSWAWERWMLRLHREMGRDNDRLLEGVQAALEEGARTGAGWRYLSGWARKPLVIY